MKIRFSASLILAALTLLAVTSRALAATPEPAAKAATAPAAAPAAKAEPTGKEAATKGKPVLEKGMDAESILKNYGQPYDIKPMEAPDKETKVERWTYRRKVKETTDQVPVGYTTITPPNPSIDDKGTTNNAYIPTATVAEYKLRRITIYQVTELLMINGKLELAKQWTGQEEKYQ